MNTSRLEEMVNGWFVGAFDPTAHRTQACEVAVKTYLAGAVEPAHFHKVATEITLVLSGTVRMCGRDFSAGDIVVLQPGEVTSFQALTDTTNVVVKVPGVSNDKYLVDPSLGEAS